MFSIEHDDIKYVLSIYNKGICIIKEYIISLGYHYNRGVYYIIENNSIYCGDKMLPIKVITYFNKCLKLKTFI